MGLSLLALTPLAVVLLGMVALRWSAALAGSAGLAVAIILTVSTFGVSAAGNAPTATVGIGAEALHATGVILWIILPALSLYEFQRSTGAVERIRGVLAGLTDQPRLQAILIAWFFGLFMEGAAGFGTPVALAAPLLVGLGFPPVRAVTLALLGHAAGVSFGAVGTPVLTQAEITGVPIGEIALTTALLHTLLGGTLLVSVVRMAGEGALTLRDLRWTALAAAAFLFPYLTLAAFAGPELPSLGGALVGMAVFVFALRCQQPLGGPGFRGLLPDIVPYLLIVALVLSSRLLPGVRDALTEAVLSWTFAGRFQGSFLPFYHPGSMLFVGFLLGAALTGRMGHVLPAVRAALGRLLPVTLALLVMLVLSRLMVHSGMIEALATAASRIGPAWPLLAPAVGVMGTFVTGSATASNILFSEFQVSTAQALALPSTLMLAAQGFGAAVGNIVAPHNIIAGSATVGLVSREGDILARTALVCALYAVAGGAILLLWIWVRSP